MPQNNTQPKLKVRKEIVIAGIAIISVIVLLGLFFLGTQFVGKATSTGYNIGGADVLIERTTGNIVTISYSGSTPISGAYLELGSVHIDNLCSIVPVSSIETLLWNGDYKTVDCKNNRIIFGDATLEEDEFRSGSVPLIRFSLNPPDVDQVTLKLNPLDAYNAEGRDLFIETTATISILCTPGAVRSCGVGACSNNTQECGADETWGNCTGVLPTEEICNGIDDNCDGQTDEGLVCNDFFNCGTFNNACQSGEECLEGVCVNATAVPEDIIAYGGGGGRLCVPDWSCGYWSFCGPELVQARTCYDRSLCESPKEESRACEPCEESWICAAWSSCVGGTQTRSCYDERGCGTAEAKPDESRSCAEPSVYVPPVYTPTLPTVEYVPPAPVVVAPASPWKQFWDKWKTWIILIPSILILALVGLLLYLHFHKPQAEVTNMDELEGWVKQELEMGISKEDIRKTLHENTGWTDQELDLAFKDLQMKEDAVKNPKAVQGQPPAQ